MKKRHFCVGLLIVGLLFSFTVFAQKEEAAPASSFTKDANNRIKKEYPFENRKDFEDAMRGLIATPEQSAIVNAEGASVYDIEKWSFLDKDTPDNVNPLLWRQGQLNKIAGLFEVIPDKIYQIRGFDISNMTFVKSNNGWVIIDVLLSKECAEAGYNLVKKHLGDLPIEAVIITHSHVDHYGGIDAILEGAPNNGFDIIAPEGFFSEIVSENLMAGVAMGRRSMYMFGAFLPKGEAGNIGTGLGQTCSVGKKGAMMPTIEIRSSKDTLTIDGLNMEFISAPGAEAPCEIMIYFPQYKAFCVAEEINKTMHNLVTLRGAKVRNGQLWSKYIDEALVKYGDEVEVSFGVHHWPTWGNKNIVDYWEKQRDMYRYLHDQTLHLANRGYTPNEIAEKVKLPRSIRRDFSNGEYYGTVSHNVKAQYQLYFGWFDGNPANLDPLPPVEAGKKYVEAMGGESNTLEIGKRAYEKGEYRWCAMVLNHLIYANPQNKEARKLLSDTYSQLAYQTGSGPWRNFYLMGAYELKNGTIKVPGMNLGKGMANGLTLEMLFDFVAIQINGEKAADKNIVINISLTDSKENATLILKNGALSNRIGYLHKHPDLKLTLTRAQLNELLLDPDSAQQLILKKQIEAEGDPLVLVDLFSTYEDSDPLFNIIEP